MKIAPPSEDVAEARDSAVQALYTLVMDVALTVAHGGEPDSGPDSMTRGEASHVVDTIVHLVQMAAVRGVCPECAGYQRLADRKGVQIELAPHPATCQERTTMSVDAMPWWRPGDHFAEGARMTLQIPDSHPWWPWLHQHAHASLDNGGLREHGEVIVSMGGIEQRYDFVNVDIDDNDGALKLTVESRMYDVRNTMNTEPITLVTAEHYTDRRGVKVTFSDGSTISVTEQQFDALCDYTGHGD